MVQRLENYFFLFLLILVITPYSISEKNEIANTIGPLDLHSLKEVNISQCYLNYQIKSTGKYLCYFTLEAIGNNYTSEGPTDCLFKIFDPYVEDLSLTILETQIPFNHSYQNSCHVISFSIIDQTFPVGFPFSIQGSFIGNFSSTSSNINTYSFGINWGTLVGSQKTTISLDGQQFSILGSVNPTPHTMEYVGLGILEYTWTETLVHGFSGSIQLQPRNVEYKCLLIDLKSWNASIGQRIVILIRNNCTFQIKGVIGTPNWITTNVSHFSMLPEQQISVSFTINSSATLGMNGSIEFIVYEPIYEIKTIPVVVIEEKQINSPNNDLMSFFILSSVCIIFFVVGLSYYNRDSINAVINDVKEKTFSFKKLKNVDLSWESIHSRWEPILPEEELEVLKILFFQGVLNQKSLADQMGVSTMTMSRIISRLESKRLLSREPLGMSNMIQLNKERL